MQKTQPKIITISDLIQWNENREIELSPRYQRNIVWNDKAKAYLIDTIVRGLPIPPVFLRQKVDVNTRTTFREVIDGQQRIRAILEFAADGFAIKSTHNKELGGKCYSDLEPDIQEEFLQYEILAETVIEKDESIVYDMFARLNSNNIVLNRQEIRNSRFWGDFKVLVYKLSSQYRDFFLSNKLLSDSDCSRMNDAELITSMILVLSEGIIGETPTVIDNFYKKYDIQFKEGDAVEQKIETVMDILEEIYDYFNGNSGCFSNKNYFFTLYCVMVNQLYGIENIDIKRNDRYSASSVMNNKKALFNALTNFISEYSSNISDKDNINGMYAEYTQFAKNHSTRTTSKAERIERISFLNDFIGNEQVI